MSQVPDAPYLAQAHAALPRILAWFDTDPVSPLRGCGDRRRWAWKLVDFANGTYQGVAHGLARLCAAGLLPEWLDEAAALRRIDACVVGAAAIRRRDGSWEEAFPHEGSFCVTALVTYDLLCATALVGERIPPATRARWLDTVRPGIAFLTRHDEGHAFISNHLATAAAALARWATLAGPDDGARARARSLWTRILAQQSDEGWFREYDGADPGYQSLAMTYLADLALVEPEWGVDVALARGWSFLSHCVHPDGSFGGLYGSRNTRLWHPGGAEAMAATCPPAAALARRLRQSIAERRVVALDAIDEPNLAPMFNGYCWAADLARRNTLPAEGTLLPCEEPAPFRRTFSAAGLTVVNHAAHYTVVGWRKGGVVCHGPKDGSPARVDAGAAGRCGATWYSTQAADCEVTPEQDDDLALVVTARFTAMHHELPSPFQMAVLRLLAATVMRWRPLSELIKRLLVRRLITGRRRLSLRNRRSIRWGDVPTISDATLGSPPRGWTPAPEMGSFSAIHMASQGYWQRQDDQR